MPLAANEKPPQPASYVPQAKKDSAKQWCYSVREFDSLHFPHFTHSTHIDFCTSFYRLHTHTNTKTHPLRPLVQTTCATTMAGFDELIERLLYDVALSGSQGEFTYLLRSLKIPQFRQSPQFESAAYMSSEQKIPARKTRHKT